MTEYVIRDNCDTQAVILPEKGATVISLKKGDKEFLYCDQENLMSPERPRCGIPYIFPVFGRLKDGKYLWDGAEYAMGIHGFAHTSPWKVSQHAEDSLELVLESNESTLVQYPFSFKVTLNFLVKDSTLTISQKYENTGTSPMPYNYGFHPYFLTEKPEDIQVEASATMQLDFVAGQIPFGHKSIQVAIPAGAPEGGACLLGVQSPTIVHYPGKDKCLTMSFDDSFPCHVLWAQAGKSFLCVEPVNGGADSLNTGNYLTLAPGETKAAFVSFKVENT